jgi:hypothetical protein
MCSRKVLHSLACLGVSLSVLACSDGAADAARAPGSGGAGGEASDAAGQAGRDMASGAGGETASGAGGETASGAAGDTSGEALDPQVPPSSAERMAEWLEAFESNGWEKDWVCEADFTEKVGGDPDIHVHGANRVCNNQALAAATLEVDAELPAGVAALKFVERGIYVEVKLSAASDGGRGWFWYAPGGEISGTGLAGCTGCHSAAGADADHPGLGDYVYFQVK